MKKLIMLIFTVLLITTFVGAGGIVTNTNQSAEFIRTLNRNASTDVDAVYFNPAGLTKLSAGLHLYISNQTIKQTREITTHYPAYNDTIFKGETFAPVFPNIYLAYKIGNLVFSGGIMPIGGGGSAEFLKGLPTFDYLLARLVGLPAKSVKEELESYGVVTGYSLDASFIGSSVYLGGQFGASYAINNMLSVAIGFRLISAKNTYEGGLKNVVLKAENGDIIGLIPDLEVDAAKKGKAFTRIFGINIALTDGLNIGLRYELLTKLEMETETKKDDTGLVLDEPMYPDGAKSNDDMPAMIAAGVAFRIMPKLRTESSFSYYFNTGVNWDGREDDVNNGYEVGITGEYSLSDRLSASVGYLISNSGATDNYQSDMSYSLNSSTIGLGMKYILNPKTALSLAFSKTNYEKGHKAISLRKLQEEYMKSSIVGAIGFQRSF